MKYNYYIDKFLHSLIFLDGKYLEVNLPGNTDRRIHDLRDSYKHLKFLSITGDKRITLTDTGYIEVIDLTSTD